LQTPAPGRTLAHGLFKDSSEVRMASAGSVTHWLHEFAAGDRGAVEKLWQRYYPQLVRLARSRLKMPALRNDAEDVALSAFDTFCRNAEEGRFPQLLGRDGLWQLLVLITARKATDLVRHRLRQKRGGGRVVSLGASPDARAEGTRLLDLIGREPDPQFAVLAAEECRRLLDALGEPVLRSVAVWKMEGSSNAEIAVRLELSVPTVERKLRLIRKVWEGEVPP
jgi:DNA-directed RNA polymerase specialized sigma24 family protein